MPQPEEDDVHVRGLVRVMAEGIKELLNKLEKLK